MSIDQFKQYKPRVAENVFIAPGAQVQVIGQVELACDVSVRSNAIVRGDKEVVTVGHNVYPACHRIS